MTKRIDNKQIIGRAEIVSLPELSLESLYARIDTGAKTSAIWASYVKEINSSLEVRFLGDAHPAYTGKTYRFQTYAKTVVASSNGQKETRYKVKLLVVLNGRKIRAAFTLADRSTQVYPVLIGRNMLRGKFIVDVHLGTPLSEEEKARTIELRDSIKEEED